MPVIGNKLTQEQPPAPNLPDYPERLNFYLERQFRLLRTETATATGDFIDPVDLATGGDGTLESPWTTTGTNPIQAAVDKILTGQVKGGGRILMSPGVYSIDGGPNGNGVEITNPTAVFAGVTLEGIAAGNRMSKLPDGRYAHDGVILLYSGTKAALKIGHWATNRSFWAEHCFFRNFKIVQAGTGHTGIGLLARLMRFSKFENVGAFGFDIGMGLSGVSDFNRFENCTVHDPGTYGVQVGRQNDENNVAFGALAGECNANRFYSCDIMGLDRSGVTPAWGMTIENNSVGNLINGCEFHNFNTLGGGYTGYGAIHIQSNGFDSIRTTVTNNYFEGNYHAVLHNNSAGAGRDCQGLDFSDNWVTQIEGYGLRCNSGLTGATRGITAKNNVFHVPSASAPYNNAIGIHTGTYVTNVFLAGNAYVVEGPAPTFNPQTYTLPGGNVVSGAGSLVEVIDDAIVWRGMYQSKMTVGSASEEVTLNTGGLITSSVADLLPAKSLILGVTARVTQGITDATNWAVGDAAQTARFSSPNASLTFGTNSVGQNHWDPTVATSNLGPVQSVAAPVQITCTGANPGAGRIRITVFYLSLSAALS
ncbi:MAG TPA: hypothetical protein VFB61_09710 [Gemmatimonadales bacterium]|nr:hypothetical protein [Gemmatimonadales bacterium]